MQESNAFYFILVVLLLSNKENPPLFGPLYPMEVERGVWFGHLSWIEPNMASHKRCSMTKISINHFWSWWKRR